MKAENKQFTFKCCANYFGLVIICMFSAVKTANALSNCSSSYNSSSSSLYSFGSYSSTPAYTYNYGSSYGGVALNKTAELLLNINDIAGASYDEATGQMIFYGKNDISLPP